MSFGAHFIKIGLQLETARRRVKLTNIWSEGRVIGRHMEVLTLTSMSRSFWVIRCTFLKIGL